MEKSFGKDNYFTDLYYTILKAIPYESNDKDWVDCVDNCFSVCHENVIKEIESTAYMLRILSKSVVGDTKNYKISFIFSVNEDQLTGIWSEDSKFFKIQILGKGTNTNTTLFSDKGRLIMGFGPSASGKTHCAQQIIKLMKSIDNTFPEFFITIDGGAFREESVVYQIILKAISDISKYDGLSNLVSSSALSLQKTIFEAGIIKKSFKNYLKDQKVNHKLIVSLYVPETLGGCVKSINCFNSYKDYIDITGDKNWIGLMIYQHKSGKECPYHHEYKCLGTTESGTKREKTEGKKYSSSAWDNSYRNGLEAIVQALTYSFRIHNSGQKDKITIFEDLSNNRLNMSDESIKTFFKANNWEYIPGKVKDYDKCKKISSKCKGKDSS